MQKKIVWVVVSYLMVLALLVTSCAKAEEKAPAPAVKEAAPVVKEAAPVVKEAAPAVKEAAPAAGAEMVKVTLTKKDGTTMEKLVEKPKYGGTFIWGMNMPVINWDEAIASPWYGSYWLDQTNDDLIMGSWYRGLAGTEEFTWATQGVFGMESMTGELAESWEIPDDETVIFHIRKGVRWQNKPPVNGRELTADDAAYNIKRIYIDIPTSTMAGMLGPAARPYEVYAKDKYTVVMKVPKGAVGDAWQNVGELTKIYSPEVLKRDGNASSWEHIVGTGPFILTDYVPMSSATYTRNPNYWEYDPVLGKDYPLPYLDTFKLVIIPDTSTRLAALRTGKIDAENGSWKKEDTLPLLKSNPNLQYLRLEPGGNSYIGGRLDKPELPFKDIRVRKTLQMAVNCQEIKDTYFGGDAEVLTYKIPPLPEFKAMGWYTPLEELPPETREIYTYNPEKAKKLLAEAGYPQGFKTDVIIPNTWTEAIDILLIIKEFWAKIGVDLKVDIKELGVHSAMYQAKTYKEMASYAHGGLFDTMYTVRKGNTYNLAMIDDPKIEEYYYPQIRDAYFDPPKKNKLMREMNLYVLSQVWYTTWPRPYMYRIWQPWVKNYHGEGGPGVYSWVVRYRYIWLDQELKKSMGY